MRRLDTIDMLRGLVIVLMILDHTRDFFHAAALVASPTDPDTTTPILFATRWVTHLCAPTFVFLAGVSAYLQHARGKLLGRFLLQRGVWLIVLEVTLVSLGFNFWFPFVFFQVIWAIGFSMVVLAALHRLPLYAIASIAVAIVAGHDLCTPLPFDAWWWKLLMTRGELSDTLYVAYAGIPWLGVMLLGYATGPVFLREDAARRLGVAGACALMAFCILRFTNVYGDPKPWTLRATGVRTVMSFFELSKYPPSLLYVLATLGTALLLYALLDRFRGPLFLLAFGRTPLFTYLLHIYLVHGSALLAGVLTGVSASAFFNILNDPDRAVAQHWGVTLPWVYVAWILLTAALYPLSRWFASVKATRRDWWLSYL